MTWDIRNNGNFRKFTYIETKPHASEPLVGQKKKAKWEIKIYLETETETPKFLGWKLYSNKCLHQKRRMFSNRQSNVAPTKRTTKTN